MGNKPVDVSGWLIRDKGRRYLATTEGWYQMEGDGLAGTGDERPVRVRGQFVAEQRLDVDVVIPLDDGGDPVRDANDRPWLVRRGLPSLAPGSRLRLEAETWLEEAGFPYLSLPSLWWQTEEYGAEELSVSYRERPLRDLRLLQSPELPLFVALTEGVSRMRTFGRCFRHESVHDPSRAGYYLMEFEQLVLAQNGTSLEEMVGLTEELVRHLIGKSGVDLSGIEFQTVDMRRALAEDPEAELLDFTVPAGWPLNAMKLLLRRLEELGCSCYVMADGELTPAAETVSPGARLLITASFEKAAVVRRTLQTASNYAGSSAEDQDLSALLAARWNPTWFAYPPLRWREGEQDDSDLAVRSFTSARGEAGGELYILDAELHLGGVEVAHVRQYASVEDMKKYAEEAGSRAKLDYLGSVKGRMPGAAAGFIGWERLQSLVQGAQSVTEVVVFPRGGSGEGYYGVS